MGFCYKDTSVKTGILRNMVQYKQEFDRILLAILKQRIYMYDQAKQEIYANIENSRKCSLYRYLIYGFNIQYYLRKSLPMKYQKSIAKIRLPSHDLSIIETGRYSTATQLKQVGVVFHVRTVLKMNITSY